MAEPREVIARLRAVGNPGQLRQMLACIGQAVQNAAVAAARAKGGRRFWQDVANSVTRRQVGDAVIVGATHVAARFKQFGGLISAPGRGPGSLHRKALAIPLDAASQHRGWNARDFETHGWELFKLPKGGGDRSVLMGRKGKRKPVVVPLFALRRAVTQKPDPWFPAGDALNRAAAKGMRLYRATYGAADHLA